MQMLKMWTNIVRMCYFLGMFWSTVKAQKTSNGFDCVGRSPGYYADINSGCQIYHMCDNIGRRFTYACPNNTLFQQRMLICDHWYMVDCATAESSYSANLRIGKKGPFVEDGEMAGMRTTRPDLLTASKEQSVERGKITPDEIFSPLNTVGLKSQSGDDAYNLPTFWSTKNSSRPPIRRYNSQGDQRNHQLHDEYTNIVDSALDKNRAKAIDFSSKTNTFNDNRQKFNPREEVQVNYESNFEATTPVFPSTVEDTTSSPNNIGLEPPGRNQHHASRQNKPFPEVKAPVSPNRGTNNKSVPGVNFVSNFKATTPVFPISIDPTNRNFDSSGFLPPKEFQSNDAVQDDFIVNFISHYKATTPVYPLSVKATSPNPDEVGVLAPKNEQFEEMKSGGGVNFPSNFKATTPVYPTSVEPTSQNPNEVGLLSPKSGLEESKISSTGVIVNFASNFKATTPVYPSSVEPTSPNPDEVGLLLPKNNEQNDTPPKNVNFASNFKATTPVYPSTVEPTSQNPDEVGLLAPKGVQNSERPSDNVVNFVSNFKATTPVYPSSVDPTSPDPNEVGLLSPKQNNINRNIEDRSDRIDQQRVNFVSNFKATTPVYPSFVDKTSIAPDKFGLLPPKQNQQKSGLVNFSSSFAATTPVYPNAVDVSSPNPNDVGLLPPKEDAPNKPFKVNFFSKFKATTPVYPTFVDPTSQKPDELGLLPPDLVGAIVANVNDKSIVNFVSNYKATTPVYPKSVDNSNEEDAQQGDVILNLDLLPPKFDETFQSDKDHYETTVAPPSRFYQPPIYEPDFTDENPGLKIANFMKSFNVSQWQELRTVFRIPEYDFPLDDATRPSYDSVFDSFDAKAVKK